MKRRRAFTIIELVIVIAVVAVLSAVLTPVFSSVVDDAIDAKYDANGKNYLLQHYIESSLENESSEHTPSNEPFLMVTEIKGDAESKSTDYTKDRFLESQKFLSVVESEINNKTKLRFMGTCIAENVQFEPFLRTAYSEYYNLYFGISFAWVDLPLNRSPWCDTDSFWDVYCTSEQNILLLNREGVEVGHIPYRSIYLTRGEDGKWQMQLYEWDGLYGKVKIELRNINLFVNCNTDIVDDDLVFVRDDGSKIKLTFY